MEAAHHPEEHNLLHDSHDQEEQDIHSTAADAQVIEEPELEEPLPDMAHDAAHDMPAYEEDLAHDASEEHPALLEEQQAIGQLDATVGLEDLSPEEQTAALYRLASYASEVQAHNARLQERSGLLQHLLIQYEEERLQHENTVKELTTELKNMQDMSSSLSQQCKQLQGDKERLEGRLETYEQSGSEQVQKMWRQVDLLEKQLKASREETSVADKQFRAMTEHCRKLEAMLQARGVTITENMTSDDILLTATPLTTVASASSASSAAPSTPPAPSPAQAVATSAFSEDDQLSSGDAAAVVEPVPQVPTPAKAPQRQSSINPRYKAAAPPSLLQRTASASPRGPAFSPAGRNLSKSSVLSPRSIPRSVPSSQSNADATRAIAAARKMRAGIAASGVNGPTSLTTSGVIKECELSDIQIKRWPHVPDVRSPSFRKKVGELPPWKI